MIKIYMYINASLMCIALQSDIVSAAIDWSSYYYEVSQWNSVFMNLLC